MSAAAPSRRILIIDDVEHLRTVLALTLRFKGYAVELAEDGRDGLERVRAAGPFDLIFCDIEMPVMNGIDFVRHYRAEYGPETPLVMLTAGDDAMIAQAMAAGATTHMIKPFEPIRLLEEVERHLRAKPEAPCR
jgi:CheY-like chemotaxis protein